jgi:hypothetical protein
MDIGPEIGRVPAQMMKSNASNTILTGLLGINLVLSAVFCFRAVTVTRDSRRLGREVRMIQLEQARFQSLAAECLAYRDKNPQIAPLLESFGMPKAAPAGTTNPAAK